MTTKKTAADIVDEKTGYKPYQEMTVVEKNLYRYALTLTSENEALKEKVEELSDELEILCTCDDTFQKLNAHCVIHGSPSPPQEGA